MLQGGFGGCQALQSPRCPALGAYPLLIGVLVPFSENSIRGFHPGCPSGAPPVPSLMIFIRG